MNDVSLNPGNRGLHMKPASYHTDWLGDPSRRDYELGVLRRIRASWVTMLTDGDSAIEVIDGKPAVRWVLENGQVPIIRDSTDPLPRSYTNIAFVEKLCVEYGRFGIRPIVILWNEPGDDREWKNFHVPSDWKEKFLNVWTQAARQVIQRGAVAAFPDPLSSWLWFFERMPDDLIRAFQEKNCVFSAHLYGKARPVNYPEDEVTRYGTPLTELEWREALGPLWDVPGWREQSLEQINELRRVLADPTKRWDDKVDGDWADTTCFGAWRNIQADALSAWGFIPEMCMNEGGWTPKDLPGSGPNTDYRWIPSTPWTIPTHTLKMFEAPMFAITPWICYGWSDDGWMYNPIMHGGEQPVIMALESDARALLLSARQKTEEALEWISALTK